MTRLGYICDSCGAIPLFRDELTEDQIAMIEADIDGRVSESENHDK